MSRQSPDTALHVAHCRQFGYHHFVINHLWRIADDLEDLRSRFLTVDSDIRCFLLSLPLDENLHRIEQRQSARSIDEQEFERRTVMEERAALYERANGDLGEPFDVSAPPARLVENILLRLGLRS